MKLRNYITTVLTGVLMCLVLLALHGILDSPDNTRTFRMLCDAFFTVGILFIGFGLLSAISTTGLFDMFGYSKDWLISVFLPFLRRGRAKDFNEYKESKSPRKPAKWHIGIVGACFFALSMVFLVIESQLTTI